MNNSDNNSILNSDMDREKARYESAMSADDLLSDSACCVAQILKNDDYANTATKNPVLVAAHMLASLLDLELGTRIATALENIAESLGSMSSRPDADDVPTDEERSIIYKALEADYIARSTSPSGEDMDGALRRFKQLARL